MSSQINDEVLIVVGEGLQLILVGLEVFVPLLSDGCDQVGELGLRAQKSSLLGTRHQLVHVALI